MRAPAKNFSPMTGANQVSCTIRVLKLEFQLQPAPDGRPRFGHVSAEGQRQALEEISRAEIRAAMVHPAKAGGCVVETLLRQRRLAQRHIGLEGERVERAKPKRARPKGGGADNIARKPMGLRPEIQRGRARGVESQRQVDGC